MTFNEISSQFQRNESAADQASAKSLLQQYRRDHGGTVWHVVEYVEKLNALRCETQCTGALFPLDEVSKWRPSSEAEWSEERPNEYPQIDLAGVPTGLRRTPDGELWEMCGLIAYTDKVWCRSVVMRERRAVPVAVASMWIVANSISPDELEGLRRGDLPTVVDDRSRKAILDQTRLILCKVAERAARIAAESPTGEVFERLARLAVDAFTATSS